MVQKLRDSACSPTDIMQISGQTGSQLMLEFPNCEDINLSNLQTQTCSFIQNLDSRNFYQNWMLSTCIFKMQKFKFSIFLLILSTHLFCAQALDFSHCMENVYVKNSKILSEYK